MTKFVLGVSLCAIGLMHLGCVEAPPVEAGEQTGTLHAALSIGQHGVTHDVARIHYVVVDSGRSCTDPPRAEATVPLQKDFPTSLAPGLLPDGGGSQHPFGDALIVLAPGTYTVCATPLTGDGGTSECDTAVTTVLIQESVTTEIALVSQCKGTSNGAVDGITILNSPPVINDLSILPSKFITTCQTARLLVFARDPDGDTLSFVWTVLSPDGSRTIGTDQLFLFTGGGLTGSFPTNITVSDPFGASTSLSFTLRVTQCVDAGTD